MSTLLVLYVVVGLLVGLLVTFLVTKQPNAWSLDVLLGVLGSVAAGQLSVLTESVRVTNPGPRSLLMAAAGGIVTVVVYRLFVRRRHA